MPSIRSRLTIMLVIGMSVLLVGAAVLMSSVLTSRLQDEFDRVLLGKAKLLMALIEDEGDAIDFDFPDEIMPEFSRSERSEYFQLWLQSEARIEKSPSLGSHDLPRLPGLSPVPIFRNTTLPSGRRGRLNQVAFIPQMEKPDDPEEQETDEQVRRILNELRDGAKRVTFDKPYLGNMAEKSSAVVDRGELQELVVRVGEQIARLHVLAASGTVLPR